ncbi:MAG: hypothetical protein HQL72_00465 [Magnetococcales bacterium]|nr:hypothetical protein [Magnetococcales bacterium]
MGSNLPADLEKIIQRMRTIAPGKECDNERLNHDLCLAETYLDRHPTTSHSILGMIATLQGREEKMRAHFKAARCIDKVSYSIRVNHILALQGFACFSESAIEAREASQIYQKNPELLAETVHACVQSGRFHEATHWMDDYDRATATTDTLPTAKTIRRISLFLRENRVADRDLESLQQQAASLLREEKVLGAALRYQLREDEIDRWLSFRFLLPLPEERVVALEWELSQRLAGSRLYDQTCRHVSIGFLAKEQP